MLCSSAAYAQAPSLDTVTPSSSPCGLSRCHGRNCAADCIGCLCVMPTTGKLLVSGKAGRALQWPVSQAGGHNCAPWGPICNNRQDVVGRRGPQTRAGATHDLCRSRFAISPSTV
jgi:hypothetical protein